MSLGMKTMKIMKIPLLAVCLLGAVWLGPAAPAGLGRDPVIFEVEADTPVVLTGKRQTVTVRALVRARGGTAARRPPLAVALVLDKSGSMSSDGKMENAKLGALEALERLDGRDVATVVVYDSEASVEAPARPASGKPAKDVFARAISRIRPGGATALYDGVRLGAAQVQPFVKDGYAPRIILLSDGIANVGPSSAQELAACGRALAKQEMTITTIGLGLDYNEDLMTALAAESGGNAYFVKNARTLSDVFAQDIEDAASLTARKVRITITCGNGARVLGAVGRKPDRKDGTMAEVTIGNLYGSEKYALFEIELPEAIEGKPVADLRLEYLDPETGTGEARTASLSLTPAKDAREVEKNRRPEIAVQKAAALNAEIREEAVRLVDEGRADDAVQMLRGRAETLRLMEPAAPARKDVEEEADSFESLAASLSEKKSMNSEQRKTVLNDAYMQKNQQTPVKRRK
jgi:Ca-activated chloride channel family protein